MSFGNTLNIFRNERKLSLRELGKLCEIDHTYIHRLEKDDKITPSNEVVESLVRNLKLSQRRAQLLRLLIGKSVNEKLIELFLKEEDYSLEIFIPLSEMSFRGKRPKSINDWRKKADQLKQWLEECE